MAIELYWCANTRAVRALWLLEEIGAKYELVRVDARAGAQNDPAFRAISPLGKVPALVDGETAVAESGAICAYLGDRFPEAKLAPPPSSPLRGPYLRWLFFAAGCIEPAFTDRMLRREGQIPHLSASWGQLRLGRGDAARRSRARPLAARRRVQHGGRLVGSACSGACRRSLLDDDVFGGYVKRLAARPALQRTLAISKGLGRGSQAGSAASSASVCRASSTITGFVSQ
jgi:glutathione S-transferase